MGFYNMFLLECDLTQFLSFIGELQCLKIVGFVIILLLFGIGNRGWNTYYIDRIATG